MSTNKMNPESEEMLSHSAQVIGEAFVRQYYYVLCNSPDLLHRFYQDTSLMGRPEDDGCLVSVTSMQAINDKIMALEYGKYEPEIMTVDAQESADGGVFVLVTGFINRENDNKINFSQSFFLATQENGYFVLNDIFRYTYFVNTEEEIQIPQEESNQICTYEQDTHDNATAEEDLAPQQEEEVNMGEVYNPPDDNEDVKDDPIVHVGVSFDTVDQLTNTLHDTNLSPTATAIHDASPKKSYASILKVRQENIHLHSSSNSYVKQEWKVSSPSPPSATTGNTSSSTSITNHAKVHEPGNGSSIYVKNLPMNATIAQLEQEFNKFGPIKSNGIQVRSRKQEGFCFGFVEFETVDAAQIAIEASPVIMDGQEVSVMVKRSTGSRANSRNRFAPRRGGGYGPKGRGSYAKKSNGMNDFNNRGDYGNMMDRRGRSANFDDGGYYQDENIVRTNRPRSSSSNVSRRNNARWGEAA